MTDSATLSTIVGAVAVALGIVALVTTRGRGDQVADYPLYLARWREVHRLEPDRLSGFLDRYYRLPYALARPLARRGVEPHLVTLAALVVAWGSLPAWIAGGAWPALAAGFVLVSGLLDQVDGAVAVLRSRTTTFGAIWDSVVDRLSDVVMLLGPTIWLVNVVGGRFVVLGVAGLVAAGTTGFLLEYIRARCQAVGYVAQQIVTPAERPTRVVVAALMGVVAAAMSAPDRLESATLVVGAVAWGLAGLTAYAATTLLLDAAHRATGDGTVGG